MNAKPERRPVGSSTSDSRTTGVRRNLFHQQFSRRPTTGLTSSTTIENIGFDTESESDISSQIVIRDENGEFQIGETAAAPLLSLDEQESGLKTRENEKDQQHLIEAIRHHQRDRNRAPSEPAELLDAVKLNLKSKMTALVEDNWLYEAEEETIA